MEICLVEMPAWAYIGIADNLKEFCAETRHQAYGREKKQLINSIYLFFLRTQKYVYQFNIQSVIRNFLLSVDQSTLS